MLHCSIECSVSKFSKFLFDLLTHPQPIYRSMENSLSSLSETIGDKQLVDEIKKYRELWLVELSNIKKVEQDVADIETDVQQLKHTVTDVKEDFTGNQRLL